MAHRTLYEVILNEAVTIGRTCTPAEAWKCMRVTYKWRDQQFAEIIRRTVVAGQIALSTDTKPTINLKGL